MEYANYSDANIDFSITIFLFGSELSMTSISDPLYASILSLTSPGNQEPSICPF